MYRLPAGVAEPGFALLHRYWESKRRGGRLPARVQIDPTEIRTLLPQLLLFEVVAGRDGPRFRLAGTAFTNLVGPATASTSWARRSGWRRSMRRSRPS